jgi:hypothetical protein
MSRRMFCRFTALAALLTVLALAHVARSANATVQDWLQVFVPAACCIVTARAIPACAAP